MNSNNSLNQESLLLGEKLFALDEYQAESFLGIQAERLEIFQDRLEQTRQLPEWSDEEAYIKITSDQRASLEDLMRYANKGKAFAMHYFGLAENALRGKICDGIELRSEIVELEGDIKELIKEIGKVMLGVMVTNLPAGLLGAAGSLATALTVILIKKRLKFFCQNGIEVVNE